MTLTLRFAARSHTGLLREGNEDSVYAGPRLLAVADGMGGHAAGEVASAVAIAAIAPLDEDAPGNDLLDVLRERADGRERPPARDGHRRPGARRHGHDAHRVPVRRQPARDAAHRRLARLPAARRRAHPDHPRPHARADAGRRGPHQRGGGEHPPAALPHHARARRPRRHRARPVGARGPTRRPLPAVHRRADRPGRPARDAAGGAADRRPAGVLRPPRAARPARRRPRQRHRHRRRRRRAATAAATPPRWSPAPRPTAPARARRTGQRVGGPRPDGRGPRRRTGGPHVGRAR